MLRAFLLLLPLALPAQVCDPSKLIGAYGFQIAGITTISGDAKAATSLGRLVFDGHGNITGNSSSMFAGYLLGNPVTGTYDLHTDCKLNWKLQDDSGAWQSFTGTMTPDLSRAQFTQPELGGPHGGILTRAPDQCSSQSLRNRYTYTVAGVTTPMIEGDMSSDISVAGTVDVARNGTFAVDSDCTVTFDLVVNATGSRLMSLHMRGMLVNGGREILAMETDPGAMVSGRFNAVLQP